MEADGEPLSNRLALTTLKNALKKIKDLDLATLLAESTATPKPEQKALDSIERVVKLGVS